MMRMLLSTDGHTVSVAGDIAAAVDLAGKQPFDLLISDFGLPDGSGHDLMRQLCARGHSLPAIALSGYGREEDVTRSRQAGFAVHLTKPASHQAISAAIASIFGNGAVEGSASRES
jgi:DNA-binding response OmpR family regulator